MYTEMYMGYLALIYSFVEFTTSCAYIRSLCTVQVPRGSGTTDGGERGGERTVQKRVVFGNHDKELVFLAPLPPTCRRGCGIGATQEILLQLRGAVCGGPVPGRDGMMTRGRARERGADPLVLAVGSEQSERVADSWFGGRTGETGLHTILNCTTK